MNLVYAIISGFLAIGFMALGYKLLDKLTPFNTGNELSGDAEKGGEGNIAVGIVVGGMFVGIGVAIGLVIASSIM